MWNRFELWYRFEGRYMLKKFKYGIRNLFIWFPTVWKDRDWDHDFIYDILRFKLKKQSEFFEKYGRHATSKRDAEKMMLVANLIEKLREDYYGSEYLNYYDATHEFIKTPDGNFYEIDSKIERENFEDFFKKYPIQYKKVKSGEIAFFRRDVERKDSKLIAMEISMSNHSRAEKLVFKILSDNISGWWC